MAEAIEGKRLCGSRSAVGCKVEVLDYIASFDMGAMLDHR